MATQTQTIITNTLIRIKEPKPSKKVLHAYKIWVEFRCGNINNSKILTTDNKGQIVIPSDMGYDIWISKYDTITKKKAKFIAKIDTKNLGKKLTIEVIKTLVKNRTVNFTKTKILHEADLKIIASELGNNSATVFGGKRFSEFATELNKMMKKYEINTRLRLIHFLAQTYHETERFTRLREKGTDTYLDGKDYKKEFCGRGLLHLTWDYGYLEYYSYLYPSIKPSYFEIHKGLYKGELTKKYTIDKKSGRPIVDISVKSYAGLTYNGKYDDGRPKVGTLPTNIDEILTGFALSLETNLSRACDSAGWFWKKNNINSKADIDDVVGVSSIINKYDTEGLPYRKKYTEILRKVII